MFNDMDDLESPYVDSSSSLIPQAPTPQVKTTTLIRPSISHKKQERLTKASTLEFHITILSVF